MLNQDFKEMLQCLLKQEVEFLLIGGYALAAHGYPRATKDMDIWVWANPLNAQKVYRALAEFGSPLDDITKDDFIKPGTVFQIGVPPNRIDILTNATGVEFSTCRQAAEIVKIEGLDIPVINKQDLIKNKQATSRPQDIVDVDVLKNSE